MNEWINIDAHLIHKDNIRKISIFPRIQTAEDIHKRKNFLFWFMDDWLRIWCHLQSRRESFLGHLREQAKFIYFYYYFNYYRSINFLLIFPLLNICWISHWIMHKWCLPNKNEVEGVRTHYPSLSFNCYTLKFYTYFGSKRNKEF